MKSRPDHSAMQRAIPALYMRGGTSKGVFFCADDLPQDVALRDRVLLRVVGSPDAYGKHTDGMGGATSSTSKVVVISRSERPDCDVDYLFGAVAIDAPIIDWSGNCGNLTAAVGPFAIERGLVQVDGEGPGHTTVRIWQANIGKRIVAHVPVRGGRVVEDGDFELDGVAFPAAEIPIEFIDPAGGGGQPLLPTGRVVDPLDVPGLGRVEATLINAGNATVIVDAATLGLRGDEMQDEVNGNPELLARCEAIRACGAVAMGLAESMAEATRARPATPKIAFVSPPCGYRASSGCDVEATDIDITVRILSMGRLHHAVTGTGAIALAVAAVLPGTLVQRIVAGQGDLGNGRIRLGHPSGTLSVGAEAVRDGDGWQVAKAVVSRSARRLMDGQVFVPARCFDHESATSHLEQEESA